jgi:hypothetical protein
MRHVVNGIKQNSRFFSVFEDLLVNGAVICGRYYQERTIYVTDLVFAKVKLCESIGG